MKEQGPEYRLARRVSICPEFSDTRVEEKTLSSISD